MGVKNLVFHVEGGTEVDMFSIIECWGGYLGLRRSR